ncbi:hypothetical protein K402DRAFT_388884 [Aulographum hederae CBS 113979]|uniref:Uncharacterized protein n=1 Tax=Aulographum hederae CBS 113979 TaxID=1176131 RepID=A0A6G1HE21_9PEZI|nr:hypothetical protein K402DRAFT_388884 [Aulographum hederae CBS 113979]
MDRDIARKEALITRNEEAISRNLDTISINDEIIAINHENAFHQFNTMNQAPYGGSRSRYNDSSAALYEANSTLREKNMLMRQENMAMRQEKRELGASWSRSSEREIEERQENDAPTVPLDPFALSIPLAIDTSSSSFLFPQLNSPSELSIPRSTIAEELAQTRLLAELLRPIKLGTFNTLPAYLLQLRLTFQRRGTGSWMSRIGAAEVGVRFEDATREVVGESDGAEKKAGRGKRWGRERERGKGREEGGKHPAVATFWPEKYEGPVTERMVETSRLVGVTAGYAPFAGVEAGVGKIKSGVEKTHLTIHGVPAGGRNSNAVNFSITADPATKDGIPPNIVFPIIVTRPPPPPPPLVSPAPSTASTLASYIPFIGPAAPSPEITTTTGQTPGRGNRFALHLTLHAHYGFWRGPIAHTVPVLGKNDEPVYFDPDVLEQMAERGDRGVDGRLVVERVVGKELGLEEWKV